MQEMNAEAVQRVLTLKPELRDEMVAAVDAQIQELQELRATIAGSAKRSGKRAASTSTSGLTHGDAVLKALAGKKKGLTSRQIRDEAKKFGHEFGNSLGTTLHNMCEKEKVSYEEIENSNQYTYFAG